MTWSYRVVRSTDPNTGETACRIYEVYYNDQEEISAITQDPVIPFGETLEELKRDLEHMLEDINRPVLEAGRIEFAPLMSKDEMNAPGIPSEEIKKRLQLD